MSYIRCLSNPEGLYLIGTMPDSAGREMNFMWGGGMHSVNAHKRDFYYLMEKFMQDEGGSLNVGEGWRRGELRLTLRNDWRWDLTFTHTGDTLTLWQVTLEYIARDVMERIQYNRKKRKKAKKRLK